jgi:hypothetical protein
MDALKRSTTMTKQIEIDGETDTFRKKWLAAFDRYLGRYQGTSLETYADDPVVAKFLDRMVAEKADIARAFDEFTRL